MSGSEETVADVHAGPSAGMSDSKDEVPELTNVKNQRKILKARITRAVNRVRESLSMDNNNIRRIKRELSQIKQDCETVRNLNSSLYNLVPSFETGRLDKWDDDLLSSIFDLEEDIEDYINSQNGFNQKTPPPLPVDQSINQDLPIANESEIVMNPESSNVPVSPSMAETPASDLSTTSEVLVQPESNPVRGPVAFREIPVISTSPSPVNKPFDSWIDDLKEYTETDLTTEARDISIAEALLKLEASRDIPSIQIPKFNGDPSMYIEFMEKFKIHIHNKCHLKDEIRMIQLTMSLEGEASRVISGMGNQGIMYATALKTLKEEFGQRSVIARTFINKLTRYSKLTLSERNKLRDLSMDIISCIAALKMICYEADINASETLRSIVKRFPDPWIGSWNNRLPDIREKGITPTIHHISDFVRKKVRSLFDPDFGEMVKPVKGDSCSKSYQTRSSNFNRSVNSTQRTFEHKCAVCGLNHSVFECPTFKSLSHNEKTNKVVELRLCFSCLNKGHVTKDCRSKRQCNINNCTRLHNKLLHKDPLPVSSTVSTLDRNGMLPILQVKVRSPNGRYRIGNLFIDSGAAATLIRTRFARDLGLQGRQEKLDLAVVGGKHIEQKLSRRLTFYVSSLDGGEEFKVEAHEIDSTISHAPPIDRQWLESFNHLRDIEFKHAAGEVDIILGVQYSHLHAEEELRQGLPFEPLAKKTKLGWYVIGPERENTQTPVCSVNFVNKVNLQTFYDFETLGVKAPDCNCPITPISLEDKHTLKVFEETCILRDGRYSIGLPWKRDPSELPESYQIAEKRLVSLERQLLKDPVKAKLYDDVIKEYQSNGWACKVNKGDNSTYATYYLPHHGVYRPDKLSTPLRVVYDPACVINGASLNSFLCRGPCLIGDLLGVLIRFRENEIAFTGDISKMFLQICLEEKDTHLHRFLWRNLDSSVEPTIFRLMRVTFGDKSSPAMASYVMIRIAEENKEMFPEAANILLNDRYMDDLIHSCETPEEALKSITQLETVLKSSGFKVKEWFCSSQSVRQKINQENSVSENNLHELSSPEFGIDGERGSNTKTLGIGWNPTSDVINFSVKDMDIKKFTKRTILSKISMFYDPLGLAAVVTIRAKIAMQEIWRLKSHDWDDLLPNSLKETWNDIFNEIKQLKTLSFPRCVKPDNAVGFPELHIFGDASINAYGAVSYLSWNTKQGRETRLVSAKVRVAPLHQTTIPRLELMAALIASRLAKTVYNELRVKPSRVFIWSDSQVVLHWLRSESATLKAFVGVRVAEIQSTWDISSFKYIPSGLNPADDLSRGLRVKDLSDRWMNGPVFLSSPEADWPVESFNTDIGFDLETKPIKTLCHVTKPELFIDISKYSNWSKLVRVTAFCLRFIAKLLKRSNIVERVLQPEELELAENLLIRNAQKGILGDFENRFRDLSPFIKDDIVRVGGRLGKSSLDYDEKHPILLTPDCHISKLIVRDFHLKNKHCGAERTLSDVRRKFWIVRGRCFVKGLIRDCVICRKLRQKAHQTLMADLPADRLKPHSPPFSVTGVDLFGPFNLKLSRNKTTKAWGVIFTCGTTRAIHLDIVENPSTPAFLHTLRRFAAQHGWPSVIISDNGSNFVGAQKELKNLLENGKTQIEDFAMSHKVSWKFNTPLSPHQGGMFESLIKQVKNALKVSIGEQIISWNEMLTVFLEVKCLINSRPLTFSSSDPNDLQPITPNHFILGRATVEIPQGPFQESKNLQKRFEFVQSLVSRFFDRLIKEYFPTLMKRAKWQSKGRQLQVGDIVLLRDSNVVRGKWQLARIIEVYPGADGIVRNVKVRTRSNEYKRSIQMCCPILEMSNL